MEKRIYHGTLIPSDVAQALLAEFNRGNLRTQLVGEGENLTVQIATTQMPRSGGQTALTVNIQSVADGVMVSVGQQEWLGVAASLGATALAALFNPLNLLGRLDDIAQDIGSLQLTEKVWQVVGDVTHMAGARKQLSERLARLVCNYCGSANPVGESNCLACGAPLGSIQPKTCSRCGYVIKQERFCPNCGQQL